MNPWGVTDTEAALMDALCEHGSVPEAAEALRITVGAARARLRNACLRMAGHKPHARLATALQGVSTITACIRWVQFTQKHS